MKDFDIQGDIGIQPIKKGIIGIVGGMGPGAGIDLSRSIVDQTLAGLDQDHLPQILWSVPEWISDRSDFLTGRLKTNPAYRIAQIISKMESVGVGVVGLACNSAHAPGIFDVVVSELEAAQSRVRLLHMIREVGRFIIRAHPGRLKVGVLGTTGTYFTRQYDLLAESGLQVMNLTEQEQKKLNLAIYHPEYGVKSVPENTSEKARNVLLSAAASLISQGAEVIVLGCTEFPLIYAESLYQNVPVVNSTQVLARALIQAHSPEKLKPWGL